MLCTFLVLRAWSACWNLYQMDLRMEAKGVTPMPAPTSMATSYWNTSSLAVPKGPSTSILAEQGLGESYGLPRALARPVGHCPYLGVCTWKVSMSCSVQSPAARMWMEKKSSSGAEVRVNGCHSSLEMAGQLTKMYCPTSMEKPFFCICSSSTRAGCITTWGHGQGSVPATLLSLASHAPVPCPPPQGHHGEELWHPRLPG